MQNKKLINVSQAVIGKQGVYSIEFHEDDHYTHVKRVNPGGSETLFPVGGSGGVTYTAGTGIDIDNGVISSTVVDTNNFISNVSLNGTDLEFVGSGGSFNSVVSLASLSSGGGETNIVPYSGSTINTDNVSTYAFRDDAEKLVLTRTAATNVDFVFEADSNFLGTLKFGIITATVTIDATGAGGIKLMYKDMTGNLVNVHGGVNQSSGNHAVTFAYFGTSGLQLIKSTEY